MRRRATATPWCSRSPRRAASRRWGSTSISRAVREMDQMTQHNAELVDRLNGSIARTEAEARTLDQLVDFFRVGRGAAGALRAA